MRELDELVENLYLFHDLCVVLNVIGELLGPNVVQIEKDSIWAFAHSTLFFFLYDLEKDACFCSQTFSRPKESLSTPGQASSLLLPAALRAADLQLVVNVPFLQPLANVKSIQLNPKNFQTDFSFLREQNRTEALQAVQVFPL